MSGVGVSVLYPNTLARSTERGALRCARAPSAVRERRVLPGRLISRHGALEGAEQLARRWIDAGRIWKAGGSVTASPPVDARRGARSLRRPGRRSWASLSRRRDIPALVRARGLSSGRPHSRHVTSSLVTRPA
ncbi:hypothetical protein MTO96_023292 [Rhipicephalus appendiculatus]